MERRAVGIVTDPDLPNEIAESIAGDLKQVLTDSVSDQIDWDIQVQCVPLPLDEYGGIIVWRNSDRIKRKNGWDMMVAITELPLRRDKHLVISEASLSHQAAVISLPALGALRPRRHVANAIIRVLREMVDDDLQPDRKVSRRASPRWTKPLVQSPVRQATISGPGGRTSHLALRGLRGRLRLLSGMVRINRPWLLVPSLSSAVAAAAAVAAFGIFYSTIWIMADSLSPLRLLLISAITIGAMVLWLIHYNNLWEKPKVHRVSKDAFLYNSATVATLLAGVTCMYVLLFVGAFLGSFIVIPAEFMQTQLEHPVTWAAYAQLSWLATSMGTVAGALGSSFETDQAIRAATYGRREQERHAKIADDEADDEAEAGDADEAGRSNHGGEQN
ncbi:hypothetical protein [Arthrobacter castelli]|uniref:hypothetical protein n=1 Tax=Arthrobacter castelli TaxID=271431 RepID=UPI0003F6BBD7|nr:hypothetical protein [Arthrobacter castelli]